MDKPLIASEVFEYELNLIKNNALKNIVAMALDNSPKCILWIPASSSGKYHPSADVETGVHDDNDNTFSTGGLVNHTRAVVGIAKCIIETDNFKHMLFGVYDDSELEVGQDLTMCADIVYASLILHDCMKPDNTPKHGTKFDHPKLASDLFLDTCKDYFITMKECPFDEMSNDDVAYLKVAIPIIKKCIASHMGQFNTAKYAPNIVLPKPSNSFELFVHLCDYIASRKFIDFNFEKYYG